MLVVFGPAEATSVHNDAEPTLFSIRNDVSVLLLSSQWKVT